MNDPYTYFERLGDTSQMPPDSILSRTLVNNAHLRLVLFQFAPGQELTEHISAMPAVIHIVSGEARLTLGDDVKEARSGAWAYMAPSLKHAIYAHTPLVMLLELVKRPGGPA
jgi:quercetin dioxygenase-like cupin family protein